MYYILSYFLWPKDDINRYCAVLLLNNGNWLSAFDTIDYSVLDRLSDWYGILGTALTWIHSFLINSYTKTIAIALITSRLDYCNSLIFKLCTVAYQTLSSGEPSYLFSMLS